MAAAKEVPGKKRMPACFGAYGEAGKKCDGYDAPTRVPALLGSESCAARSDAYRDASPSVKEEWFRH